MKPSNTLLNKISFNGVLQPLVDLLERSPRSRGKLSGQEVIITRKDIQTIIAIDGDNNIHLLITPALTNDSRIFQLELKGLKASNVEWVVAGRPVQSYLDISCSTGILPSFRRPFLRFIEDVLFEISQSEITPADAVYRTSVRWKKFWSPDTEAEVTKEWVHGIFGELLFLRELIARFGPKVINSWEGPLGRDHDFQTGGSLAVEVKTSAKIPYSINCNIRQLDHTLFKLLYIACYHVTPSEEGSILPEIVNSIEKSIPKEGSLLDKFYEKLIAAGYSRQQEPLYADFRLNYDEPVVFKVDDNFPKITQGSFINPPDARISGIKYTLQLTNIKELTINEVAAELIILAN
jgi:hypothetical protein